MSRSTREQSTYPSRPVRAAALALGAALAAAGCAASAEQDGEMSLDIGYFPLVHTATAVHAAEAGLFAGAGLEAELHQTGGGAEAIPSLMAGEFDIVYGNYVSAIIAAQQGMPVVIVAGNDVGAEDHAIMVEEGSPLSGPADLEGATVAVNNLENIGTLAVRAIVEEHGGDPFAVDFVELPYPDMQAALDKGEVDAIWQVEPFTTGALEAGHEALFDLFSGPAADMPVAGWITTADYAEQNPEAVAAFQGALAESAGQVQDDRELLVDLVPSYTEVPEEVVAEVAMPVWEAAPDSERLQTTATLMEQYGIIDEPFNVSDMIIEP